MEPLVNDRWRGSFGVDQLGRWRYTLVAWVDAFKTWRRDLVKKVEAGQDVSVDLLTGAELIEAAAERARATAADVAAPRAPASESVHALGQPAAASAADADAERLEAWARLLRGRGPTDTVRYPATHTADEGVAQVTAEGGSERSEAGVPPASANNVAAALVAGVLDEELAGLVATYPDRHFATTYGRELGVVVDREKARFSAWYEFFPRSRPIGSGRPGSLRHANRGEQETSADAKGARPAERPPARDTDPSKQETPPEGNAPKGDTLHEATPSARQDPPQADPGKHNTLRDAEAMLPYIAGMGFDVVYLPPIHPIGHTHRKGKNNAPVAERDDVGSPWAIGAETGGHTALHPDLGTLEDFRRFVRQAEANGLEVALDIAFQASPDHPWVKEHPEWFRWRPDGTIQYAENPPKKYEDIYPFDFGTADFTDSSTPSDLWQALRDVFLFWHEQGVRIFRVDNPHTKPLPFWEWLIADVKERDPGVIFLSEAFTRPKMMYRLAKLGFTQSYTYFAWRNTKWELEQYFTELTRTEVREYFRPNLWPNTPDILTEYLQTGGRPAFVARLVLAATMGASYGIYGPAFELFEGRAREPGSEEYLDSEKYQSRQWELDRPDSLRGLIARVNRIRREERALQGDDTLRFHPVDNDLLIAYTKHLDKPSNLILVVVNLDPYHVQSGWLELALDELGVPSHEPYQVRDLLGGASYLWQGPRNYVELNPHVVPAHIFRVGRRVRTEQDFEYFM